MLKILTAFALVLSLAGCSILHTYRPDVQQGNVISDTQVAKLRHGMRKQQVAKIMGDPVLQNVFADNRWEYIDINWPNSGPTTREAVIVTFKNNRVVKIEKQAKQVQN